MDLHEAEELQAGIDLGHEADIRETFAKFRALVSEMQTVDNLIKVYGEAFVARALDLLALEEADDENAIEETHKQHRATIKLWKNKTKVTDNRGMLNHPHRTFVRLANDDMAAFAKLAREEFDEMTAEEFIDLAADALCEDFSLSESSLSVSHQKAFRQSAVLRLARKRDEQADDGQHCYEAIKEYLKRDAASDRNAVEHGTNDDTEFDDEAGRVNNTTVAAKSIVGKGSPAAKAVAAMLGPDGVYRVNENIDTKKALRDFKEDVVIPESDTRKSLREFI